MASNSWSLKTIRTTITLGADTFAGGGNTIVIEGLATSVQVTKAGTPSQNEADVEIQGISLTDMGSLTVLGFKPKEQNKNTIVIEAGEQGGTLSTVFSGEITSAVAEFSNAPDVSMTFKCQTGGQGNLTAAAPVSTQGETTAAELIRGFAKEMGYTFKNEGVTASVKNAVFNGSPYQKILAVAEQVGCEVIIDDGQVIIMQSGTARESVTVTLSKESGLIGYPAFDDEGITLTAAFNPSIQYGGKITVESTVPSASGTWKIINIKHALSAYQPDGGEWYSEIKAVPLDAVVSSGG